MIINNSANDLEYNQPLECNHQEECQSGVVGPITLCECENHCRKPMGHKGPMIVKVPVVLSEAKIQIDVEADIRLEQRAYDIKTIDKKVCLTQCHLVPYTNKLFLKGYIEKNIQYSTAECVGKNSISGNIQHTTVKIPFHCVTALKFVEYPEYGKTLKERITPLDKNMMCPDDAEDSWVHFNRYYEPVYCELEWVKVLESDMYEYAGNYGKDEKGFDEFTEKMVVYLGIKVLQKKQVYIPKPYSKDHKEKDHDKCDGYKEYDKDEKKGKYEEYDKYDEFDKYDEYDEYDE